jgi:hypothetical protein
MLGICIGLERGRLEWKVSLQASRLEGSMLEIEGSQSHSNDEGVDSPLIALSLGVLQFEGCSMAARESSKSTNVQSNSARLPTRVLKDFVQNPLLM